MDSKRNMKIGVMTAGIFIILILAFMSWYYPLSPYSIHKSITYHPSADNTYEKEVSEFKLSYEQDLKNYLESESYNPTVNRTQFILPVFEQEWLISTDPQAINRDRLDRMLFEIEQTRNTLIDFVSEEGFSKEAKVHMVDNIKYFLNLEESIRFIRDGKYFTRNEFQRLLSNLHGDFWQGFTHYTDNFYAESHA